MLTPCLPVCCDAACAGSVQTLTEQLSSLEASSADLDNRLKQLQEEHSKVGLQTWRSQ
jgi:hypothetical protein